MTALGTAAIAVGGLIYYYVTSDSSGPDVPPVKPATPEVPEKPDPINH